MKQFNLAKQAFLAGKQNKTTFEGWFVNNEALQVDIFEELYRLSCAKVVGEPPSVVLNSREQTYSEIKHCLRGMIKKRFPDISYRVIGKVEKRCGNKRFPHHTTILNSVEKYEHGYYEDYIKHEIEKIFNLLL